MSFIFSKEQRLLNSKDYTHVFTASERKSSDSYFTVLRRFSLSEKYSRLGVVVAKKNIRRAHERNRVKRLIRESFRYYQWPNSYDVVVLAKHSAQYVDNRVLFKSLLRHWERIGQ